MIEASRLATAPVAQDVRRNSTRDRGEEFGIALEAQISAAETAREFQTLGERVADLQASFDPTSVAVEQLASRPEHVPGGLKSQVQDEMSSEKGDSEAAEADEGRVKSEQVVQREGKSAGVVKANTIEAAQVQVEPVTGAVAGAQAVARKGEPALEAEKPAEKQGKTVDSAMSRSAEVSSVAAVAQARTSGGHEKRDSGTGKNPHVSAVDALGALGRKTVFKVAVTERAQQADMDKFVAQTAKALAAAVKREGGTFVMRLNPENLGLLKVRVETKAGNVNARVEASESSARQLLVEDIESLRSALEAHGVCVEKIEIVRMDDPQGMSAADFRGSGTDPGNSERQAEDRQRDAAERRDAGRGVEEAAGEFMDESAGVYLCGVELRVDAIA